MCTRSATFSSLESATSIGWVAPQARRNRNCARQCRGRLRVGITIVKRELAGISVNATFSGGPLRVPARHTIELYARRSDTLSVRTLLSPDSFQIFHGALPDTHRSSR